jgi:glycosyltransferase involved in cell wall biosynthesis
MKPRLRILIIENSRHVTGALKSIFAMTQDLHDSFEFIFILPSGSAATPWIQSRSSTRVIEVPMKEIARSWRVTCYIPMLFINAFRVKRIIQKEKIDIVHSNDVYNLIGPTLKFFGFKFKYLCHIRFLPGGFPPWLFNFWIRRQLAVAERILVVSDFLKNQVLHDPKIHRIHCRILSSSSDDSPPVRSGNTILYMANVIPGKGHDYAIRAFAQLHQKFPSWKLKIVGSDMGLEKNRRYINQLKAMAVKLQVADKIEWKDFVSAVVTEYKTADIFVNFSVSESFSMTCLEAQYYGCCAVATTSGGPAEIIDDCVSGFLVPVGDINAMIKALGQLMSDRQLRETMGANGARIVREKFGVEKTSWELKNVYMVTFASAG